MLVVTRDEEQSILVGVELHARLTQTGILAWTTSNHAFLQSLRKLESRRRGKLRSESGSMFSSVQFDTRASGLS
jgi:hypothetical protein